MPLPIAAAGIIWAVLSAIPASVILAVAQPYMQEWFEGNRPALDEVARKLGEAVAEFFFERLGLELDEKKPLSDASFCGAIEKKTGMALRTLLDRDKIRADAEYFGLAQLEARSGLRIRNPRDAVKVRQDVFRWVTPVVSERSGIPLADLSDVDRTRSDVGEYVKDVALVFLADDLERARSVITGLGVDLSEIVRTIQVKGGIDPKTRLPVVNIGVEMIVLGIVSRALIAAEKRRRNVILTCDKNHAKLSAKRRAMLKFRERHGHRMYYLPLGMPEPPKTPD